MAVVSMKNDEMRPNLQQVKDWIQTVLERDLFRCQFSPLSESEHWNFESGAIRHTSKRFFSVVGLSWQMNGKTHYQPFLDQREVGTLGFVVRGQPGFREILVYAKSEPGNVGVVQLAPSCQATLSNLSQVHGGCPPPCVDEFNRESGVYLSDSLQSEQGSRFWCKRNRNAVVLNNDAEVQLDTHRWLPLDYFVKLMSEDYLVNTDARSTIVCSDWPSLFGRDLFCGSGTFVSGLRKSYHRNPDKQLLREVKETISKRAQQAPPVEMCALDEMPGWNYCPQSPHTVAGEEHSILHISTRCCTREVSAWDQPIFSTRREMQQTLMCASIDNVARFGFRYLWEPGLLRKVELSTTYSGELPSAYDASKTLLQVRQSDEGGRFYHDVTQYSVREAQEIVDDESVVWLTLSEIAHLLPLGYFNNEARSALSLLMAKI